MRIRVSMYGSKFHAVVSRLAQRLSAEAIMDAMKGAAFGKKAEGAIGRSGDVRRLKDVRQSLQEVLRNELPGIRRTR